MGVKQSSYVLGWLLTNFAKFILVVIVFIVPCIIANVFEATVVIDGERV